MTWQLKEQLRRKLEREQGYYLFPPGARSRFALVYPNSYHVGMSNLGIHIIYDILNRRGDTACERFFLPDKKEMAAYARTHTPLLSLETQTPLADFPVIGVSLSFEMDYFHVLDILAAGRVPLLAEQRGARDPIVLGGGPCATFNPEPLAAFFDAFLIGEGEETIARFMDAFYEAKRDDCSREKTLRRLAKIPGIYVPSLYEPAYQETGEVAALRADADASPRVSRQWVRDLDAYPAHTVVVTPDTEFDLYLIETARGCGRHCRFCMAGYCFRRPRNRSRRVLQEEIAAASAYNKRIGLMGAAISDYPEIDGLCDDILSSGLTMSVASFRVDSVTPKLMESLISSGMKTLTMAPEAGSNRMRAVINKGITEEHLFRAMDLGVAAGLRHYRLYLMIGLPGECPADIDAIVDLAIRLKSYLESKGNKGTLTLSVNPFIPKPFTPFQWVPMMEKVVVERELRQLRQGLKGHKGIELLTESVKGAYVQGVLARGDRRLGQVLKAAHEAGGAGAFFRTLRTFGLDADFYLYRRRTEEEIFPWDMLDMGIERRYLWAELKRAERGAETLPCFDGCQRCGVCAG
ncbi:MAG: TIGR03960 family B12-binding radical SAM protein [Schwartzia sp. (in: firmicutes)]